MPKFDLSTPKGMGAFNGFISSKSYVEGYAYSQVGVEQSQIRAAKRAKGQGCSVTVE